MTRSATSLALLLALLSVFAVAASAQTNPPLVGTYKTLTGQLLNGYATVSQPVPGATGLNTPGDIIDAQSYNGTLGTQWKVTCPVAGASTLVFDGVVGGNGQRIFNTPYLGGQLWLAGSGPWGTGDPQYTGGFSSFSVTTVQQWSNNAIVGIVANVNFTGMLDGYANCFTMSISNAEFVGFDAGAPYPPVLGPGSCDVPGTFSSDWNVHDITFTLSGPCAVNAKQPTWGHLKGIYR
jgi:hypothetical protein